MSRAKQCSECGCLGHHLMGCPEGERIWELAEMRIAAEIASESHWEECENDEPFDAVSEIMAQFISIYGERQKKSILGQ